MDRTDEKILNLMKGNARISFQELGNAIGISRVAAKKRVAKLEKEGIIRGYNTYILREDEITLLIDIVSKEGELESVIAYLNTSVIGIRQIFRVGKGNRLHIVLVSDSVENLDYIYRMIRKDCKGLIEEISGGIVREIIKDVYGGIRYDSGTGAGPSPREDQGSDEGN